MSETFKPGAARALFFATTAFAVSFAVWGLIAALAPLFTELYKLSATEKSLLIAIPVLLGSIGRIFAGMAADRFGGRIVFSALLIFSAIPAVAIGFSTSYTQLLVFGLLLGVAGTTFPAARTRIRQRRDRKLYHRLRLAFTLRARLSGSILFEFYPQ